MRILIAVIDDLYIFALRTSLAPFFFVRRHFFGWETTRPKSASSYASPSDPVFAESAPPQTFKKVEEVLAKERPFSEVGKNTIMYSGGAETPMYMHPTREFDSIIGMLGYGDMVMVLEQRGRWARVIHGEREGWVLREDLADRAAHVYPKFVPGEPNEAEDPNTIRVRAVLGDRFGGAKSNLPLQAGEYVLYRLARKGLEIHWPEIRPRTPGRWHSILKGVPGIHIGVSPKTGAVMEYMLDEDRGHLAYVEAVFPDETINISEVNRTEDGAYLEQVLTREAWQKLRPVFIQVV